MSNYRDMRTRIANELARDDLSTEIGNFIQDAIRHYQTDFFARGYKEYASGSTVGAGTETVALPSDFLNWVYLRWYEPPTSPFTYFTLEEKNLETVLGLQFQHPLIRATPSVYALDHANLTLVLGPVPSQDGKLSGRYQYLIPAPTSDVAPNNGEIGTVAAFWMNQAEAMVRAYAKFLINTQMLRDDEAAKTNAVTANEEYLSLRRAYESQIYRSGIIPSGDGWQGEESFSGGWW